jgi:hypothetical protein
MTVSDEQPREIGCRRVVDMVALIAIFQAYPSHLSGSRAVKQRTPTSPIGHMAPVHNQQLVNTL